MRRQRHLKQAASRFLRQSLVNHQSRELPCRQMIDRVFPSCPSSWLRCNLTSWIILSRMGFRLSDRVCEHHTQANSCMSLEMALLVDVSRLPKSARIAWSLAGGVDEAKDLPPACRVRF